MLELGYQKDGEEREVEVGYRIYISGDTLMGESIRHFYNWRSLTQIA